MVLQKFTIFGERNSGTNYLENILKKKLYLKFTKEYGYKHWYIKNLEPRGINNTTTDNECKKSIDDSDDTLFIVIVRNVYDWVGAMYKKPHHIKNMKRNSLLNFISNKYIAFENKCPNGHSNKSKTPWYKNKNHKYPYFMEEAKNLIELRNMKNNHFYNLQNKVKHFYLIRQEHLLEDIDNMIKKFDLKYRFKGLIKYRKPSKYFINIKTFYFIKYYLNNKIDNEIYK